MERPNIFNFAKRELSQDAVVAWFIACVHSANQIYKEMGLNFIRFIFNDSTIANSEISVEKESPHVQYKNMDVYVIIRVKNKLYPVIFEDKTNTYIHSNQLERYCLKVSGWMNNTYLNKISDELKIKELTWGNILYVYYKTGYVFGWQREDFSVQTAKAIKKINDNNQSLVIREIYTDDMITFLNNYNNINIDIISDYCNFLKERKEKWEYAIKNSFTENSEQYNKCFSSGAGCAQLFEYIFGKNVQFNYDYQGWASKDILFFGNEPLSDRIVYCFRFDWCTYDKNKKCYAFQLQQYRDESRREGKESIQFKIDNAQQVQQVCKEIVSSLDIQKINIRFEPINENSKAYNGKMIMKIFIVEDSTPLNVCNFISIFLNRLCDELKDLFPNCFTRLI